jgi:hypothetical protein
MSPNTGNINYSLNKNDFYKVLTGTLIYFIPYYYVLLIISVIFLITIRFTKLVAYDNTSINNYFYAITFNSPFKILQLEKKTLDGNSYVGLSGYSYLILIVFYMITVILILKGLIRNLIYSIYVNIIQLNSNNNPYRNVNCVTKIKDNAIVVTLLNYAGIISMTLVFFIPFIIPYVIKLFKMDLYDIKKSSWFPYVILYLLLFPFINVLISQGVFYTKLEIFNGLNRFLEKKDYPFVKFIKNNFNFRIRYLIVLIFIVFIYAFYVILYSYHKYDSSTLWKIYGIIFLALFIIVPVVIFCFSINMIFSNDYQDKVKHSELINNINKDGVQSLYELLVKYNYPCFFK